MTAALPRVQSAPIHAVYFGGGMPTDLTPEQIRQLGKVIKANLPLNHVKLSTALIQHNNGGDAQV